MYVVFQNMDASKIKNTCSNLNTFKFIYLLFSGIDKTVNMYTGDGNYHVRKTSKYNMIYNIIQLLRYNIMLGH